MKENKTKPDIRFKGFTEAWEQRKLGDSCKINGRIGFRGYTEKDIVTKKAGGVLTFSPTNIVDNKLTMECKNTYITREKYDESPEIKISNGDILFVKTGSTLGKSALVTGLKEDASINPQIVVMRVEKNTETFMSNILITNGVMKQVAAVKIGGAVPTMTETELKNFTYFAPAEKEEKKKIGDFFRTLDHLITLHQRECDQLKELKKSMLKKMFPRDESSIPEVRFAGFTDAWEQRKLGGLLFKVGKKNKNNLSLEAYSITNDNGFIPQDEAHDEFGYMKNTDKSAYIIVPPFSFGYNPARINVGSIGYYNGKKNVIVSSLYEVFQTNKALNDQFLWYWLKSDELTKWIEKLQEGSVRLYFYYDKLEQCLISISSVEEQIKIGQYFSQLDNLITLHQRELEILKNLKKTCLKRMFI